MENALKAFPSLVFDLLLGKVIYFYETLSKQKSFYRKYIFP